MNTVVVVGNPRLGSRTRQAAELVVERLTDAGPTTVIELSELGAPSGVGGGVLVTGSVTVAGEARLLLGAEMGEGTFHPEHAAPRRHVREE